MSDDFPIVALVCSAGGLDALTRVLAPLPADLPAAIIALQHLDPERASQLPALLQARSALPHSAPERPSQLPALLQARTALPVIAAADGAVLRPGQVLVAPSGQHT